MHEDPTAHTQSGSAGHARRERVFGWLRANATSVLIAVMVVAALFGTRALGIAVADHKDHLLAAQLLVPKSQTEAQSIVAVTQDYVGGLGDRSVAASRIARLRAQLSSDITALAGSWSHRSTETAVPAAAGLGMAATALVSDFPQADSGSAPTQQLTAVSANYQGLAASLQATGSDLRGRPGQPTRWSAA